MSIAAHEWVARSSVDPAVQERWPDYRVVLVAADGVDIARLATAADTLVDRAVADARALDALDRHVARWQQTYRDEPIVDHPDPGEPVWVHDSGVTCRRWNWRQTARTAIHEGTTTVGFIIDSLDAPDHHGAHCAAGHLADLLPAAHARSIGGRHTQES